MTKQYSVSLQIVDDQTVKNTEIFEDTKFFIVRSEWFWTRIAEGYAPEDDFLFKDVSNKIG
jgi:hypothetical protein